MSIKLSDFKEDDERQNPGKDSHPAADYRPLHARKMSRLLQAELHLPLPHPKNNQGRSPSLIYWIKESRLLKGSDRVNRILGPEEDFSDALTDSPRKQREQEQLPNPV
jgi:hypothetical protein